MTPISATVAMEIRGDKLFICEHTGSVDEMVSSHVVLLSPEARATLKAAVSSPSEGSLSLMGGKAVLSFTDQGSDSYLVEWKSGHDFTATLNSTQLAGLASLL